MSQHTDEINQFLMGGTGKAFEFDAIGQSVTGIISDMKKRQQTDFQTNSPMYWADGSPRMMLQVTLQTDLKDNEEDEGLRNLYLRGGNFTAVKGKGTSSLVAVKDAVKRSGAADGIQVGGTLMLQFTGEGAAPTKGMNPSKLYVATYSPPAYAISMDDLA